VHHIYNEDIEDVLQRVDHTVKDGLELGHPVNGLEGPQDAQHSQRFHSAQVLGGHVAATKEEREDGAADHNKVQAVPDVPEVGALVAHHAQVDHLEGHLDGEDHSEAVVEVVENLVAAAVLVDGILGG